MADGQHENRPAEPKATTERAGAAHGVDGPLLGVLTISPARERNGNDVLRSIERVPEIVDVTPTGAVLQLHAEVDSIAHLELIADRFRRQVSVAAVTAHLLGGDPFASPSIDHPASS